MLREINFTLILAVLIVGFVGTSCPLYNTAIKGIFCWSANSLVWWKSNSWQECRERCVSKLYSSIPCQNWQWESNGGMCSLKNGDNHCTEHENGYISGNVNTMPTGSCSTTCQVGEWGNWVDNCSTGNDYGGIKYRSRNINKLPMNPLESCPQLLQMSNCGTPNVKYNVSNNSLEVNQEKISCPNFDIGALGWGCNFEDNLNYGNIKILEATNWQQCFNLCNENNSCTNFSFKEENNNSNSPCYLILGELGCQFHGLGWVSGSSRINPSDSCHVSCVVGEWSTWSGCSNSLCKDNQGYSYRNRKILTNQRGNGTKCPETQETTLCTSEYTCNEHNCLVGEWGSWSECNTQCGGIKKRLRTIQQPSNIGGNFCPHIFEVSVDGCTSSSTPYCSKSCSYSDWSQWSACTKTCGGGLQTRTRTSKGSDCGQNKQYQSCNKQECSEPQKYTGQQLSSGIFTPKEIKDQLNRMCSLYGYSDLLEFEVMNFDLSFISK